MSTTLLTPPPSDAVERARALVPPAPRTLEEAGINLDLAVQLVIKLLHFAGELTGIEISRRLGLDFQVVEPAMTFLKRLHQVEIVGGSAIGGPSYLYRITDAGRERAHAVSREQPLRRRGAGAAGAIRRLSERLSAGDAAVDHAANACGARSAIWC